MWRKYRTSIILAISFIVLLSAFWFFPSLAFIIFISLLLQLLLNSTVDRLESRRIPRTLAAASVLIGFLLLLTLFVAIVSSSFIPTFTRFIEELPNLSSNLQNLPYLQDSNFIAKEFDSLWAEMTNFSVDALKSSLLVLISIFNKVIDFVIILFVTFYLLKDGNEIKRYLAGLFPHSDYSRVIDLFDRILASLRGYIRSQLIICFITGIVVFAYFTLRGLPYASVFAVVSGISEFIPVLGPTVASAFGTLLTATQDPWAAVQTMLFYLILTQVNHNLIYPTLIGKSLNLHPVAIILGIILGGELLNAAGMFLAVPCIGICKLIIEDIHPDRLQTLQVTRLKKRRLARKKRKSQEDF